MDMIETWIFRKMTKSYMSSVRFWKVFIKKRNWIWSCFVLTDTRLFETYRLVRRRELVDEVYTEYVWGTVGGVERGVTSRHWWLFVQNKDLVVVVELSRVYGKRGRKKIFRTVHGPLGDYLCLLTDQGGTGRTWDYSDRWSIMKVQDIPGRRQTNVNLLVLKDILPCVWSIVTLWKNTVSILSRRRWVSYVLRF